MAPHILVEETAAFLKSKHRIFRSWPFKQLLSMACVIPKTLSTMGHGVLFDVLSADTDVLEQALSGMSTALFHWVFSAQCKYSHVLQRQQQLHQSHVHLLSKDLAHLITLIL